MNWVDRVLQMEAFVREDDQEGRAGTLGGLDHADVIWAAWSNDGQTPVIRVIRGRDLSGPYSLPVAMGRDAQGRDRTCRYTMSIMPLIG